jgi:hypothetical protein
MGSMEAMEAMEATGDMEATKGKKLKVNAMIR